MIIICKRFHLKNIVILHLIVKKNRNYLAVHFTTARTRVIPVPTRGGYRNLLTKREDSGTTGTSFGRTTGTSFGRIPLCCSRNDEPCL